MSRFPSLVTSLVTSLVMGVVLAGCGTSSPSPGPDGPTGGSSAGPATGQGPSTGSDVPSPPPTEEPAPLAGKVVVLDPGHQLGNRHHASEINAPVDAGGFEKACNTTGTATSGGYPEATFVWEVSKVLQRQLRRLGARVVLTRDADSDALWGPCVDVRGSVGNPGEPGPDADLRLSLHGDGSLAGDAYGFHVIAPGDLAGWTDDIVKPSRRLARDVRDALVAGGFTPSTYRGEDGIDIRTDLGTLNHSDVPAVMVELANMRHPDEAAVLETAPGRARYARALTRAIRAYLAD